LWRIEGGRGRAGDVSQIYGNFIAVEKGPLVRRIRYQQNDEERMNYGDRILIVVHCAFILDACCRPVDGANVGGRVPPLANAVPPGEPPAASAATPAPAAAAATPSPGLSAGIDPKTSVVFDPGLGVIQMVEGACATPPWGYGPWTSGSGTPGSTFESWIQIYDPDAKTSLSSGGT
ncbi:MAG TPA: hypothetical protein VMQ73_24290, partial [Methylomirabilota bacterium]|nr:hypothetical protein [Methylomirabilota bacterium]